jgi:NAD(P)-dependent dehydrogenase (short-subunit alcohol dehydrogenase family)
VAVAACRSLGVRSEQIMVEVADEASVSQLFDAVDALWSPTDLGALVNCAGIVAPAARVEDIDLLRLKAVAAEGIRVMAVVWGSSTPTSTPRAGSPIGPNGCGH